MGKMKDLTIQDEMTYAEWYQNVEKPRLAAITPEQRVLNEYSHRIGVVDECYACIDCEIKSWNAWKEFCRG